MSRKPDLEKIFGSIYNEYDFIKKSYDILKGFDFTDENAIASVCVCRDEISQTVMSHIKRMWGEAFNFASLAGLFTAGRTGMKAFTSHAPKVDSKDRYIYYAFSHIGIDENGDIGFCKRRGIEKSTACGALCLFRDELSRGEVNSMSDESDKEEVFLRRRILKELKYGEVPDLLTITKITRKVIVEDLEKIIQNVVDPQKADYAIFSGIQVHGPEGNYIVPYESYLKINDEKMKIEI